MPSFDFSIPWMLQLLAAFASLGQAAEVDKAPHDTGAAFAYVRNLPAPSVAIIERGK